jgi:hypothetical protein
MTLARSFRWETDRARQFLPQRGAHQKREGASSPITLSGADTKVRFEGPGRIVKRDRAVRQRVDELTHERVGGGVDLRDGTVGGNDPVRDEVNVIDGLQRLTTS